MANPTVFKRPAKHPTDTVNRAGGTAYSLTNHEALAQYVCTGTFNNTFYSTGENQLEEVERLISLAAPDFRYRLALYARETAYMKDMPALLMAYCSGFDKNQIGSLYWDHVAAMVLDNGKMVRNFVQIIRSGRVSGRKSLGTCPKRLVKRYLELTPPKQVLAETIGKNPSLADLIKMVHPHPKNAEQSAFFAWVIGKCKCVKALPLFIKDYEDFKGSSLADNVNRNAPDVPFQMLLSLGGGLTKSMWNQIVLNGKWHQTRMNLNTYLRNGVFKNKYMVEVVAEKLSNKGVINLSKVFPYQIMAAYLNIGEEMPAKIINALHEAMEHATTNVPSFDGDMVVGVDCSASMHAPITGFRLGSSSKVRMVDVAALFASCVLRKNPETKIVPFTTCAHSCRLEPLDSIMTNSTKLAALPSGGTACSVPISVANEKEWPCDLMIIVSDSESWADKPHHWGNGSPTKTMDEWRILKKKNPKAKLVLIDLHPTSDTQADTQAKDVLYVAGFSDNVFKVIAKFAGGDGSSQQWVDTINSVRLPWEIDE